MLWLLPTIAFASPLYIWDFEDNDGGFTSTSALQFEWGSFSTPPPPFPPQNSGWATKLDAHYLNDASDTLAFPALNLSNSTRPVLTLLHWYAIEDSALGDSARVEVLQEGEWTRLNPAYSYPSIRGFAGLSDNWENVYFDLSGLGDTPQIRLAFVSGLTTSFQGWTIDAMSIIDGDPAPPIFIDVLPPHDTTDLAGPYRVRATAIDDFSFPALTLFWETEDSATQAVTMEALGDGLFEASIPGQPSQTTVNWWLEADDGTNITSYPDIGTAHFRVALAAPTDLNADGLLSGGRIAADRVTLHWRAPTGELEANAYHITRDDEHVATTASTSATVALKSGSQAFRVAAEFAPAWAELDHTYQSDQSEALWLHAAIPYIDRLEPKQGWPGDRMRIDLQGDNLYLSEGDIQLDAGHGITVEELFIIDANHIRALIAIAPEATVGPRQLILDSGHTTISAQPSFFVMNEAGRPQVIAARPPTVRQGASTVVFIDIGTPHPGESDDTLIDLGEGIFVESISPRSTGYDVAVVIAPDAPLGSHAIVVHQGDHLLTGASLEVLDTPSAIQKGCTISQISPRTQIPFMAGLLALCLRRQRR